MAEREWTDAMRAAMAEVANCFTPREPRLMARQMCEAMLMELDTTAASCHTGVGCADDRPRALLVSVFSAVVTRMATCISLATCL